MTVIDKLERGSISTTARGFNPSAEASPVAIDARRHELVLEPGSETFCVNGDFDRLVQVFSHLLSNAAPDDGVTL